MGFRSGGLGSWFGGSIYQHSTIYLHLSQMPCLQVGDFTDDMYPILAVYQRIFQNFCTDWQTVIFAEHFGANCVILWRTVAIFSGPLCS